ncbi:glycosyltransferase family 2 protein [Bacillus daqingensis]|uniref:Glycosyltransferase family 2 protein n=1 Tax=Bacillus daqingensis TaxID=872396 RepID=A0ABV9NQD5_9BACI
MNPLVSVGVAVYNAEATIVECLKSILNQSYYNLEIIIIDDGSTDRSLDLITEMARCDNRIFTKSQSNQGLSKVRQLLIQEATGSYITFVDHDDIVSCTFVETLVSQTIEHDADLAVCETKPFYKSIEMNELYQIADSPRCLESGEALKQYMSGELGGYVLYGKLFKTTILSKIAFPAGDYQDAITMPEILHRANKIIYIPKVLHYNRVHENSVTANIEANLIKRLQIKNIYFHNVELFKQYYPYLLDELELHYFNSLFGIVNEAIMKDRNSVLEKELRFLLKNSLPIIIRHPSFALKRKLLIVAYCVKPKLATSIGSPFFRGKLT